MKSYNNVLGDFSAILSKHDPAGLAQGAPDDEYAPEALSILSRFVESGLQVSEDPKAIKQVSEAIVAGALEFWFMDPPKDVVELTNELVQCYVKSMEEEQ